MDPPSLGELLDSASTKGVKSGKNILLVFGGSWCTACKAFEHYLKTAPQGKLILSRFEVVFLSAFEDGRKAKSNAGADEFYMKYAGRLDRRNVMINFPYYAVLNPSTRKIIVSSLANPRETKSNIGFPGKSDEVNHFIKILSTGSPNFTKEELQSIKLSLLRPNPAGAHVVK